MTTIDINARQQLQSFARQITDHLNDIADLQELVKGLKAEAKSDGYDLKALGQIIKEMRKGPKHQAEQLQFELVLDTYRAAVELPTDLEAAQAAAKAAAEQVPANDDRPRRSRSSLASLSDEERSELN